MPREPFRTSGHGHGLREVRWVLGLRAVVLEPYVPPGSSGHPGLCGRGPCRQGVQGTGAWT